MSCKDCNGMCRQGRDCPRRIVWSDYQARYYNLLTWLRGLLK
jgi:hypothetical protein